MNKTFEGGEQAPVNTEAVLDAWSASYHTINSLVTEPVDLAHLCLTYREGDVLRELTPAEKADTLQLIRQDYEPKTLVKDIPNEAGDLVSDISLIEHMDAKTEETTLMWLEEVYKVNPDTNQKGDLHFARVAIADEAVIEDDLRRAA
jgi:hypothetical protein